MITFEQAATERAAAVRTHADRPTQRRSDEFGHPHVTRSLPSAMQIREADTGSGKLAFSGHASVYETGYEMWDLYGPYTEIVSAGAAAESLARGDLDVPLVLDHDPMRRIASTVNGSLQLSEDEIGLLTIAPELDPEDHDVRYIYPKMRAGLIYEMSFRFRIIAGQWSPDYTEYRINAFDIHRGDVSIVGYGANPHTTSELRTDVPIIGERKPRSRGVDLIHDFDVLSRAL